MFGLGGSEIGIIAIIVLLIFGARRLPEIGKGLGGAVREFRNIKKEIKGTEAASSEKKAEKQGAPDFESRMKDKVIQQIPGLKTASKIREHAEKVTKIIG